MSNIYPLREIQPSQYEIQQARKRHPSQLFNGFSETSYAESVLDGYGLTHESEVYAFPTGEHLENTHRRRNLVGLMGSKIKQYPFSASYVVTIFTGLIVIQGFIR